MTLLNDPKRNTLGDSILLFTIDDRDRNQRSLTKSWKTALKCNYRKESQKSLGSKDVTFNENRLAKFLKCEKSHGAVRKKNIEVKNG